MNKTEFIIVPKVQKVLVTKGSYQVHKIANSNSHKHISVALTILASGNYIPSLFSYTGICAIPNLLNGASAGKVMGFTDTRYMHKSLFQMYIEHFIKSISSSQPILLILDEHKSYVNYMSVNFCYKNGILLYALPSHTTHILQPSELPFATLKSEYSKKCDKFHNDTGKLLTKHTFAQMLGLTFIKTYTLLAIINAYRATGTWPLNPNAISPDHLDPSLLTE
ncbi:22495_t:CDS:1 [Cetraspora pellucida]|uniref:22495_t:CDS:1 n=1 Tax=Cetraspora pellucida TaxID=1433469 RepID=A0A9N9F128_9GLOM|nr:22495_t:CDS:1 [Cetraspora pellucida]